MIRDIFKTNTNRAYVYKILAEFYNPPQENVAELGRVLKIKAESLYPHSITHINGHKFELDSLLLDFSRLFLGPYKLLSPPYGSLYLEKNGQIMGESTMDVLKIYQKNGLQIEGNHIPDHISVELEFIYFLITKEIESDGDKDVNTFRDKQKIFIKQHLALWVFSFTKSLNENAKTEFYKNLAHFTRDFIKAEITWMNE
jgi:TorA maturation chaperone TorD